MRRVIHGLLALGALPVAVVVLNGLVASARAKDAVFGWGSGAWPMLTMAALLLVMAVRPRELLMAMAAGLTATALTSLLFVVSGAEQVQGLQLVYACASAVTAVLLGMLRINPLAVVLAGAANVWALLALARLEHGVGGSLLEAEPGLLMPVLAIWAFLMVALLLGRLRRR